jgi:CubicO group peptidase (beta-lactamase class C family)
MRDGPEGGVASSGRCSRETGVLEAPAGQLVTPLEIPGPVAYGFAGLFPLAGVDAAVFKVRLKKLLYLFFPRAPAIYYLRESGQFTSMSGVPMRVLVLAVFCSVLISPGTASSKSDFVDFATLAGLVQPAQEALIMVSAGVQPATALALACVQTPSPAWTGRDTGHANLSSQAVTNLVAPLLANNPGGAVSVGIVSPAGVSTYGFGSTGGPLSPAPDGDSIFLIGSITKTFTGTLTAQAVLDGRMDMNAPAQSYMPQGVILPSYNGTPITMNNLVTHTGDLPANIPNSDPSVAIGFNPTWQQYSSTVNSSNLTRAPGTMYEYTNLGASLAGQAVETVYGQSYETLLQQRILIPLGMDSTTSLPVSSQNPNLVQTWESPGVLVPNSAKYTSPQGSPLGSSGSISSTANDMNKYMRAYLGLSDSPLGLSPLLAATPRFDVTIQNVIPQNLAVTMGLTPQGQYLFSLGMFWQLSPANGVMTLNKSGQVPGGVANVVMDQAEQTGVFIAYNTSQLDSGNPSGLVNSISNNLLNLQTQLTKYEKAALMTAQ